jgi:hypothetical protein
VLGPACPFLSRDDTRGRKDSSFAGPILSSLVPARPLLLITDFATTADAPPLTWAVESLRRREGGR